MHAIALTQAKGGSGGQPAPPYAPVSSDILIWEIFEGTGEIQRMVIGRSVTGLDVRLFCTYRVNAGAKAHPHPREVT